jgi:membrane associated rhomboid family serine protease
MGHANMTHLVSNVLSFVAFGSICEYFFKLYYSRERYLYTIFLFILLSTLSFYLIWPTAIGFSGVVYMVMGTCVILWVRDGINSNRTILLINSLLVFVFTMYMISAEFLFAHELIENIGSLPLMLNPPEYSRGSAIIHSYSGIFGILFGITIITIGIIKPFIYSSLRKINFLWS